MIKNISLIERLHALFPDSSKRTLKTWLKKGKVLVDGQVIFAPHFLLEEEAKVELRKGQIFTSLPVLYEDDHLIIIDKPVGLLSVPLDREGPKSAFVIMRKHYPTLFAVHRIDKTTSGVLVFAKTEEAKEGMDELFHSHNLIREYIALLEGELTGEGTWESRLSEKTHFEVQKDSEGKLAITHFETLKPTKKCSWVRLVLETGRKHQIRVHAKDAHHPIVGDKRYGSTMNPYRRICLHAHRISFTHPITKKNIDCKGSHPSFFPEDVCKLMMKK